MNILLVNYEYPPVGGGGGVVVRDIFEQVALLGHNITIITSHFRGLKKHEKINGVNIIRVPVLFRKKMEVANIISMLSYLPSSVAKGTIYLKENHFDVINTHFAIPSGPTGHILSKRFGIPNVLSIHGGDIFDPSKRLSPHQTPILYGTVKRMMCSADRVVAQSSDTKKNAIEYYRINCPIDIIPLGIKKPTFQKKTRADFNLDADDFIFCTIGRLIKRKNLFDILNILSELGDKRNFKLIIIGDGPEANNISRQIERTNLKEKVLMFGNISDEKKFQLLNLSDCYISSATHEGFGLVFLEAMESGLPVISYNRGGQNDFLIDGKTGFLIELGDMDMFLEKVLAIIRDTDLRKRMREYNKKLAQDFYISACASNYLKLFVDVITKNKDIHRK